MKNGRSTIADLIFEVLRDDRPKSTRRTFNYKGIRTNIFGLPQFKNVPKGTLEVTLSRLRKRGLVDTDMEKGWHLTPNGKSFQRRKYDSLQQFSSPFTEVNPKRNLLVMFDIPENKKGEREWFRWHLKKFKYSMIQKSVWVGPSPLPNEFSEYAKKIGLKDSIKTFKLAHAYTGKSREW